MKITRSAGFAIGIALLYSTAAGVCQSLREQPEIPFRLVRDSVVVVSFMANNQGPFAFVLDIGADTTILDPSLAGILLLASRRNIQQTTVAGVQTLGGSPIDSLAAGPARVDKLPVLVQNLSELRKRDPQIEGIIGQDFLSHFNYLLDYRKHSLRIELNNEVRNAIDGELLPIETRDNRMTVAAEVQSGGSTTLRLLLDSGATSIVLMREAQTLSLRAQKKSVAITSSGHVGLQMGTIHSLTVGSQQFRDIAVAQTSIPTEERIADGLLPMAPFQALYIHNRENFVVLNPRRRKN